MVLKIGFRKNGPRSVLEAQLFHFLSAFLKKLSPFVLTLPLILVEGDSSIS